MENKIWAAFTLAILALTAAASALTFSIINAHPKTYNSITVVSNGFKYYFEPMIEYKNGWFEKQEIWFEGETPKETYHPAGYYLVWKTSRPFPIKTEKPPAVTYEMSTQRPLD